MPRPRYEADLVVEVLLDVGVLGKRVPAPVQEQRTDVVGLLTVGHAGRVGLRDERVNGKTLRGRKQHVARDEPVEVRRAGRFLVDHETADLRAGHHVLGVAGHKEIVARTSYDFLRLEIEDGDVVASIQLSRHPGAADDRDLLTGIREPDPAAEEQVHVPLEPLRAHRELTRVLQEEIAFLREEERKPRKVHLLLVDLGLGEVGVQREVEREPGAHAVLHVEAGVTQGPAEGC